MPKTLDKKPERIMEAEGVLVQPYIPADQLLPEITVKAFLLSILLTAIMAAANAYLGLKIGMTVSATIPAAVISMAVLKLFRKSNILENNIVQITVSTGEALAAASVFTFPGLILMHYWTDFPFWQIASMLIVGGILGVFLSVILRRALIVDANLKFPEGIAAAEVLKVGDGHQKTGAKSLVAGAIFAAILKFGQSGIVVFSESIGYWKKAFGTVSGISTGFGGILVGAGYIVGLQVGISMILGAIVGWGICIPIYTYLQPVDWSLGAEAIAMKVWVEKVRIVGVGTMLVSGVWIAFSVLGSMKKAISDAVKALKSSRANKITRALSLRTEKDIPISYVGWGILTSGVILTLLIHFIFIEQGLNPSSIDFYWPILLVTSLSIIGIIFLLTVVYGYIMGIIGATNSPLSGMTIIGVLFICLVLLVLLSRYIDTIGTVSMASIALLFAGLIAGAIVVGAESLQDLKAGQIVGATPWKQQTMLIVGVIVSAFTMGPILNLMLQAYGIGDVMPDPNMDPSKTLAAPKGALMAAISQNIFGHSMDWGLLSVGIAIGAFFIVVDELLKFMKIGWRIPTLAVSFGIYMPLDMTFPIALGGLIAHLAERKIKSQKAKAGTDFERKAADTRHRGLLVASGIIAGEAIVGVIIAAILIWGHTLKDAMQSIHIHSDLRILFGIVMFGVLSWYLYKTASKLKGIKS